MNYQLLCRLLKEFFFRTGVNPGSTNIAFDVVLSKDALHAEQDFVLKFDRILTNIGNGYNAAKGIFTAPVSGTYLFSWNIRSGYHASIISKLMVNGRPMQATHTDSSLDTQYGFEAHSSKTVILTINEADQVWIENFPQRGEIHSSIDGGYTGFVGTLLF